MKALSLSLTSYHQITFKLNANSRDNKYLVLSVLGHMAKVDNLEKILEMSGKLG